MNDITLLNGEKISVNINWLTIKILNDHGLEKLQEDIEKDENQLSVASLLIYAILRSNGIMVSEEEALSLIAIDDETIFKLFELFSEQLTKFKKKQDSKKSLKKVIK